MRAGVYILWIESFKLFLQSWGFTFCFLCFSLSFLFKDKKNGRHRYLLGSFSFRPGNRRSLCIGRKPTDSKSGLFLL